MRIHKVRDYLNAVSAAKTIHGLSTFAAIKSVVHARTALGFGPRYHALWGMAGIPVSQWQYFQRETELEAVLRRLNPMNRRDVVNNKILFAEHCKAHGIAHAETVYHDVAVGGQHGKEHQDEFFRSIESGPDTIFFKLIGGAHGHGAFQAERKGSTWVFCGEHGTLDDLYNFCRNRKGSNCGWIVQHVLRTHASLHDLSSRQALSSARLLTCITPEGPKLLFAAMKLARGANVIDNFGVGETGNMIAAIDIDSGRLGPARGSLSKDFPYIRAFDVDPVSSEPIAGRLIPFWQETKALVLQAQSTLPELRSLGWDVAITDDGPFLVEANSTYGTDSMQVAQGRGIKRELLHQLQELP